MESLSVLFNPYTDYISYESSSRTFSYVPRDNDGYELRNYPRNAAILVTLTDVGGYQYDFQVIIELTVPLMFSSHLPDFKVTAGKPAYIQLPEILVEEDYTQD